MIELFAVLANLVHIAISMGLFISGLYPDAYAECGVGLSSVLFALLVIRMNLSGGRTARFFFFFFFFCVLGGEIRGLDLLPSFYLTHTTSFFSLNQDSLAL
jgi:hypothetical protein